MNRGRNRGVTLIELVVTLTIAGILLSIGVPSYTQYVASQRVRSAATDLQTALMVTRSEAIKRNARLTLQPNADGWSSGWQLLDPNNADNDNFALVSHDLPSGLTVAGSEGTLPTDGITYRSSGRTLNAANLIIRVSSSQVTSATPRCIDITLAGQPSMLESCP